MQIQKANIQFKKTLSNRPFTRRIVVHHSASAPSTTIQTIHQWHLSKGWSGIGYHFVVYADGTIYEGRPIQKQGAHAYQDAKHEANTDGIGICLCGNFMSALPTDAQLQSLVWLIGYIHGIYPNIPVIGHKDVMATSCPGAMFPWGKLNTMLKGGITLAQLQDWMPKAVQEAKKAGLIANDHDPLEPVNMATLCAMMLNLKKLIKEGKI